MPVKIITGDCRDVLRTLTDESVHCVVTSPPYFGLRDYGVAGQIGLEPDFNEYIAAMVEVFRAVRRVLRKDGTLWLNLGDSYVGNGLSGGDGSKAFGGTRPDKIARQKSIISDDIGPKQYHGLKPKDLCGIPWRVALALQADGWYLRQDIIWGKPNPMPESVRDRCTKAHEYIFLLSKSERYHFDQEAIKEFGGADMGPGVNHGEAPADYDRLNDRQDELHSRIGRKGNANGFRGGSYVNGVPGPRKRTGNVANDAFRRNKRSVWTVATAPYAEAHFATFPPALIEPCIEAGCPPGGTVLDPFFGAGTTGLVADRLQRNCIGIELNDSYAAMSRKRITDDAPLLAYGEAAE